MRVMADNWPGMLAALMAWGSVLFIWELYGVWQNRWIEEKVLCHTAWESKKAEKCLTGKRAVLAAVLLLALLQFFICYIQNMPCGIHTKVKLCLLLALLAAVSLIDYVKKIIPNILVFSVMGFRLLWLIPEYLTKKNDFYATLWMDGIGFAVCFGILLLAALLSRRSIGMGDVKLFGAIGMTLGIIGAYNTLFYSMLCALAAALYIVLVKKKGRKYKIPFAPAVLAGYLCVLAFQAF